jgi:hypothetical protein
MIDFDHPVTSATLRRFPAYEPEDVAARQFWAHLARRSDGGPATPAALELALARRRERSRSDAAAKIRTAVVESSPLPRDAPF